MGFRAFDSLGASESAAGYGLRTFRPGDEDAWIELLCSGDFGVWDRARLDRMLGGDRAPMPFEGIFFATQDDRPVGVANCFFYAYDDPPEAEIGWVVVAPEHRGHGLARMIVTGALCFIRDRRYRYAFLKTEDYRIAAIRLYLRLAFEPEMVDPAHPAWWAAFEREHGAYRT